MDEVGIMKVVVAMVVAVDNILAPRTPSRRMGEIMNRPKMWNTLITDVEAKAIGVVLQNIS